jgi:membrane dipeptidase
MKGTFPAGLGYEVGAGLRCVSPVQIEQVVECQIRAGYTEADIANILGRNLMRLAKAVWKPPRATAHPA